MKKIPVLILLSIISILLTSCVFIDDNCYYETRCSYVVYCGSICDEFGYNCVQTDCYETVDYCWDEYICRDY
jgi:hypothetical protein